MNRTARLKELDRMNREARDALTRERIRGIVIGWRNDFMRLERILKKPLPGYDAETMALLIGGTAGDCASYQITHLAVQDATLSMALEEYEKALTGRICDCVKDASAAGRDIEDAIVWLAGNQALDRVIDYLDLLLRQLEE